MWYLPDNEDVWENLTKIWKSGKQAIVKLQSNEEYNDQGYKFREEEALVEYMSYPKRTWQHYKQHKYTEDEEGEGHPVNDRWRNTVELLSDVKACESWADHLHEELPLFKEEDRQVNKKQEGEVDDRVHYFDEGHSPYDFIDSLSQLLAAELQAAASTTYNHLINHLLYKEI